MQVLERVAHGGKLYFPEDVITKQEVCDYFSMVAPAFVRHLRGRPLTFRRWPDGIGKPGFYQKNVPPHLEASVPQWTIEGTRYAVVTEFSEIWPFITEGAIEIHVPPISWPDAELPDTAFVDLDPMPPFGFKDARQVARMVLAALDAIGLRARIKTSGQTGLHLFIPIRRGPTSREISLALRGLGVELKRAAPDLIALERSVARRTGVYFDYLQNARGHTLAAAYSLRASHGAPVSCPIPAQALPDVVPSTFNLRTVPARLQSFGDAWEDGLEAQDPAKLLTLARLGRERR